MKTRILVVDDEPDFTSMMKLSLEMDGKYEVREENVATRAMHVAREFLPNVVLLDVMMPEMSGLDVAAGFRSDDQLKNTPVIFISALIRQNGPPRFPMPMGKNYTYLPKPVSAQVLLESIEKAVEPAPI